MARQFFEFPETKNILAPYLDPRGDVWRFIQAALDPTQMPSRSDLQDMAIRSGYRRLVEKYVDPQVAMLGCWTNEICKSLEVFEWFRENTPTEYVHEQISGMTLNEIDPPLMVVLIRDYLSEMRESNFCSYMWEDLPRELAEIIIDGTPEGYLLPGFISWEDLRHKHYAGINSSVQAMNYLGLEDFGRLLPLLDATMMRMHSVHSRPITIHDVRGMPELVKYLCVDCRLGRSVMLDIVKNAQFPADVYRELVKYMEVSQSELWSIIARVGSQRDDLLDRADSPPADFKIIANHRKDIYDFLHSRWPRETVKGMRGLITESRSILGYLVDYGYVWDGITSELSRIQYLPKYNDVFAYYYSGGHAEAAHLLASRNTVFCENYHTTKPSEFTLLGFRLFKKWVSQVIRYGDEKEIDYVIEHRSEWC
jgi:hypothetical protein